MTVTNFLLSDVQNQRRLGEMRMLAALYCNRLLDTNCLYTVLFKVLNFGHDIPQPAGSTTGTAPAVNDQGVKAEGSYSSDALPTLNLYPSYCSSYLIGGMGAGRFGRGFHPLIPTALDSQEDLFRLQLIATALSACGQYFRRGRHANKLDRLLLYVQRYAACKPLLTTDVTFMLEGTFALQLLLRLSLTILLIDLFEDLRPGTAPPGTLSLAQCEARVMALEAKEAAVVEERNRAQLSADRSTNSAVGGTLDEDEDEEEDLSEEEEEEDVGDTSLGGEDASSDIDGGRESGTDHCGGEEEDDVIVVVAPPMERTDEDDAFESDFLSMISGSMEDARKARGLAAAGSTTGSRASAAVLNLEHMPGSGAAALALARNRDRDGSLREREEQVQLGGHFREPRPPINAVSGALKFKVLQRGNRGRVETRDLLVPSDVGLAKAGKAALDARAREVAELQQHAAQYEQREREQEAEAFQGSGGLLPWGEVAKANEGPMCDESPEPDDGTFRGRGRNRRGGRRGR